MQITFDPANGDDTKLIRQLFMQTTQAPPTGEKEAPAGMGENAPVAARPRGRPAKVEVTPERALAEVVADNPTPAPVSPAAEAPAPRATPSIDVVRQALMTYATVAGEGKDEAAKSADGQAKAKAIMLQHGGSARLSEVKSDNYNAILDAVAGASKGLGKK